MFNILKLSLTFSLTILFFQNGVSQNIKRYYGFFDKPNSYMMSQSYGGSKIFLTKGDSVELIGVESNKVKVFIYQMEGYVWPEEIRMSDQYIEFLNAFPDFVNSNSNLISRIKVHEDLKKTYVNFGRNSSNLPKQSSLSGAGIGFAYSSAKSLEVDLVFITRNNLIKLGYSEEFSDRQGKKVTDVKWNYGQTSNGSGSYFYTIDFGYGRIFNNRLILESEFSFGKRNYYTNYLDARFNGGGYHIINSSSSVAGVGLVTGIRWDFVSIELGYNTIKNFKFGLRFLLVK